MSGLEVVSKPHLRLNSPPASPALGHEPFGSELRVELLGPNGAARDGGQAALQTARLPSTSSGPELAEGSSSQASSKCSPEEVI